MDKQKYEDALAHYSELTGTEVLNVATCSAGENERAALLEYICPKCDGIHYLILHRSSHSNSGNSGVIPFESQLGVPSELGQALMINAIATRNAEVASSTSDDSGYDSLFTKFMSLLDVYVQDALDSYIDGISEKFDTLIRERLGVGDVKDLH